MKGMYILLNRENGDFWQGLIGDQVNDSHFFMDVFSPLTGLTSMTTVVSIEEVCATKSELFDTHEDFLAGYKKRMDRLKTESVVNSDRDSDILSAWLSRKISSGDTEWIGFHKNDLGKNGPVRNSERRDRALDRLLETGFLSTSDWKTYTVNV